MSAETHFLPAELRHDTSAQVYLTSLLNFPLPRLVKEQVRSRQHLIGTERTSLLKTAETQAVAQSRIYMATAKKATGLKETVDALHRRSEEVVKTIGLLETAASHSLRSAGECAKLQSACRSVGSQAALLVQVLELPQMMRTYLDTKNYDAVAQLFEFTLQLIAKFPESQGIRQIGEAALSFKQELLTGLTSELSRSAGPAGQLIE
jgi:hypothetical protein